LQGGAGVIGKLLALAVAVSAQVKHQMADRIGGISAVSEQIIKAFVARDSLVLAKGGQ
jgi:hypothetical protein